MDVRCEKCQTEYELDESRLKPGGVTVKCTNCGHMFKIRKRANTNVGVAAAERTKPVSSKQPLTSDKPAGTPDKISDTPSGPSADRQWLVRLENGDTKTCRELATLQQWIVAGVVSRESLISRTGKTWKRLGDIAELGQYFIIADEARVHRAAKPTNKPGVKVGAGTIMGVGAVKPHEEEDLEGRTTGNFRTHPSTPPPPSQPTFPAAAQPQGLSSPTVRFGAEPSAKSPTPAPPIAAARQPTPAPPMSSVRANPIAQTELAPSGPMHAAEPEKNIPVPAGGRATAMWANNEVKQSESMVAMPQGPRGGKLTPGVHEPAFAAGRVRMTPSVDQSFAGRVGEIDDDEHMYPHRQGSRAGMWIAIVSLVVIVGAAGAVYLFVFRSGKSEVATKQADAAVAVGDASTLVVTPIDATEALSPLDTARAELVAGVLPRMRKALEALATAEDPPSLAMRARLQTAIAQAMQDRAGFVERAEADKLRKDAKQPVIDAANLAQRAFNAQADDPSANLAMADVMRLQAKPAPSVKRYLETARTKAGADKSLLASVALAEAQLLVRDGKLPDAQKALAGVEVPDDMRIKIESALIAYAQGKPADAKASVDLVLATQPENDVAMAMYKKLETTVTKTDPLPPEDGSANAGSATKPPPSGGSKPPPGGGGGGGGDSYDSLLARANKLAESNCGKASELFAKALVEKPNGVEALTGMGYCQLEAKQFSSAFSKFRAALAVSPKYEPALGGVAETYQRQGNKEAAIDAWKKYAELYPNSPKAKKQLEILGAGEKKEPPKEQPKEQPKEPPKETPAPPPSGSGS